MKLIDPKQKDETLVMLTLAGEQQAFELLVVRYQNAVIAAANGVLRNRYLAEDVAQDAFITAWMKLNVLREPEKFGAWVCRIAKNCAKNMATRFQSYLNLDDLENTISEQERVANPEFLLVASENADQLRQSIENLPERIKQVIRMHYFEELSVAEIADRMRISQSTVKWHLHDGRKRIRKDLCAMNEKENDNLVQRVMKKVEELKLWKLKNSKDGFETVYKDVLAEVEELPESIDKYHALADVLMHGWWWLPGEKNDKLLDRIRESAELGKNEEVMEFIVGKEIRDLRGNNAVELIRDRQIPELEAAGFHRTAAHQWFWLGYYYFDAGEDEKGYEAYEKARSLMTPADIYYTFALVSAEMEKKYAAEYKEKNQKFCKVEAKAEELRLTDGAWRRLDSHWNGKGYLYAADTDADDIFFNASRCDRYFTVPELAVGETYTGSDGSTLTYADDCATVETPMGNFDGCQLWITSYDNTAYKTYYKDGVGIVKLEKTSGGIVETRLLKSCTILGGKGIIPFAAGNSWEYTANYNPESMLQQSKFTITHADDQSVILSGIWSLERLKYDENSWIDMIQQIRNDYWQEAEDGQQKIADVYAAIARAEELAKTPMEKAHTKAACSVARRILETDTIFNPDYTATGHWNFFVRQTTEKKNGKVTIQDDFRWSFEWKRWTSGDEPLLYNDIYGILQDAANCIWSNEWRPGSTPTVEYLLWGSKPIKTKIVCEDAGSITTRAGTFENCLKIALDIKGMTGGHDYRGGKKVYWFAPSVGIVRTENEYASGSRKAVYELTAYTGTGEGYMPLADGMTRRYDALDLTDGFVGSADYSYVAGEDGQIVIFEDRCGIQKRPEKITRYDAILGEYVEANLWAQEKYVESRVRCAVNHFNILLHLFGRNSRAWALPERAVAWSLHKGAILDTLKVDGELPRAWWGLYAEWQFRRACYLFGCDRKEEGYELLEQALNELYPKWIAIPDGEVLELGDKEIFLGVKYVKGQGLLELPDGSREPVYDENTLELNIGMPYYGMTAPHGWEWFNGPRGEERFKAAIEVAKNLTKKP